MSVRVSFLSRRTALMGSAAIAMLSVSTACSEPVEKIKPIGNSPHKVELGEKIYLWPNDAPGIQGVTAVEEEILRKPGGPKDDTAFINVTRPFLIPVLPLGKPKSTLLIIPGGGYRRVSVGHGTLDIAKYFAAQNIAVYVLVYRLPGNKWIAGPNAPLQDAQRAIRVISATRKEQEVSDSKFRVIGFSAGGHLAARISSYISPLLYSPVDKVDALSPVIESTALVYPVLHLTGPHAHKGSYKQLFKNGVPAEGTDMISGFTGISSETPPTILFHAQNDRIVSSQNSVDMHTTLKELGRPTQLHIFDQGGHGFGLKNKDGELNPWVRLYENWIERSFN